MADLVKTSQIRKVSDFPRELRFLLEKAEHTDESIQVPIPALQGRSLAQAAEDGDIPAVRRVLMRQLEFMGIQPFKY